MELKENLHLDILKKIHGPKDSSDLDSSSSSSSSSWESEGEREGGGRPRSGSSSGSCTPVSSPRAHLRWDPSYDTANKTDNELVLRTLQEGSVRWRTFNTLSLTDDDKLHADKTSALTLTDEAGVTDEDSNRLTQAASAGLPDVIPAATGRAGVVVSPFDDDFDPPPPLPSTDPPLLDSQSSSPRSLPSPLIDPPPPLPLSPPPTLGTENAPHWTDKAPSTPSTTAPSEPRDQKRLFPGPPLDIPQPQSLASAAQEPILSPPMMFKGPPKEALILDIDEEFDSILRDFDPEPVFGRRDGYGKLLSPIIESPSPTPSSLSGISSASPDPLSMFRMSPGPRSKRETDLSSLRLTPHDRKENGQENHQLPVQLKPNTSPRPHQWVTFDEDAKTGSSFAALDNLRIPDYPWDSDAELSSPSSTEWDAFPNGLCSSQSLGPNTQIGTYVLGWRKPDNIIYEESETPGGSSSAGDDTDSEDTLEGEATDLTTDVLVHQEETDDGKHGGETETQKYQAGVGTETSQYQAGVGTETSQYQAGVGTETSQYQADVGTETQQYQAGVGTETQQYQAGVGTETQQYQAGVGTETQQYQAGVVAESGHECQMSGKHVDGHWLPRETGSSLISNTPEVSKDTENGETVTNGFVSSDLATSIALAAIEQQQQCLTGSDTGSDTSSSSGDSDSEDTLETGATTPANNASSTSTDSDRNDQSTCTDIGSDTDGDDIDFNSADNDDELDIIDVSLHLEVSGALDAVRARSSPERLLPERQEIDLPSADIPTEDSPSTVPAELCLGLESEGSDEELPSPNHSSYGSGVRVSQYTSDDSDRSSSDSPFLHNLWMARFRPKASRRARQGTREVQARNEKPFELLEKQTTAETSSGSASLNPQPCDEVEGLNTLNEDELVVDESRNNRFVKAEPEAIERINVRDLDRCENENANEKPYCEPAIHAEPATRVHTEQRLSKSDQTHTEIRADGKPLHIKVRHLVRKRSIRDEIESGTVETLSKRFKASTGGRDICAHAEQRLTNNIDEDIQLDVTNLTNHAISTANETLEVVDHLDSEGSDGARSDDTAESDSQTRWSSVPGSETAHAANPVIEHWAVESKSENNDVAVNFSNDLLSPRNNTNTSSKDYASGSESEVSDSGSEGSGDSFGQYISSEDELAGPGMRMDPDIFQYTNYQVRVPSWTASRDGQYRVYGTRAGEKLIDNSRRKAGLPGALHSDVRNDKYKVDFSFIARDGQGDQEKLQVTSQPGTGASDTQRRPDTGPTTRVRNDRRQTTGGDVSVPLTDALHQTWEMRDGSAVQQGRREDRARPANHYSTPPTTQTIAHSPMSSSDEGVSLDLPTSSVTGPARNDASVEFEISPGVNVLEDERGNMRIWPYSDIDDQDRVPVRVLPNQRLVRVQENSGGMKVIQSSERSAEMPANKVMEKCRTSSVVPYNASSQQLMRTHAESMHSALNADTNGNTISEEDLAQVLPKIAESVARMQNTNAEEILPGITQSVSKLQNGGNLVVTTMTRKLTEEEDQCQPEKGSSEAYPVIKVDDLDSSKIYFVEDSKGDLFVVEDITSEDTQESAYYGSSRHTSGYTSDASASPPYQRISQIRKVGESNIRQATAEELLSAMYNDTGIVEINENEEETSERTYEYRLPAKRQHEGSALNSKESLSTSYTVEEPDGTRTYTQQPQPSSSTRTTTKDHYEYEMADVVPWGQGQQLQPVSMETDMQGDGYQTKMKKDYETTETNAAGYSSSHATYTMDAETSLVPHAKASPAGTTAYMTPQPPLIQPPPPPPAPEQPQYKLVKVDMTPKVTVEEEQEAKLDMREREAETKMEDRPIFKTVAVIPPPERHPPEEMKTYKLLNSKASTPEETRMSLDQVDSRFTTETVEYKVSSPTLQRKQFFVRNSEKTAAPTPQRFRSEQRLEVSRPPEQKYRTAIQVKGASSSNRQEDAVASSSHSYSEQTTEKTTRNFEQSEGSMRVVRGSYMIKNQLDEPDGQYDDNINMFHGEFSLCKDNPLYQSDEDIYRKHDAEKAEHARRQEQFERDLNQDITFETVDKFTKTKTVKREERPQQSLSQLLLQKISTIDAKDIRQNIDVKHHSEDIYGDPKFVHADGTDGIQRGREGTNNFDSVGEKVDLMLKDGKAFITVKVTAERITPVDMEFNVWRKNQAIVTRVIEVDLQATEQRRRLYRHVMSEVEPAGGSRSTSSYGPTETVLDSRQTLDLFTKILGATDGEGDHEDITVKTRVGNTSMPFTSGMDLLY